MFRALAAQLRRPSGLFGRLVARLMNAVNRPMNREALAALAPAPESRVLEVGFGGGAMLRMLLDAAPEGKVAGLDLSPTMIERARRTFAAELRAGRLELREGAIERIPFGDASFDRVLTSNTLYFWSDPAAAVGEAHRVLAPAGRFVVAYGTAESMRDDPVTRHGFTVYETEEVERMLRAAGFHAVDTRLHGAGRTAFAVTVGEKRDGAGAGD
jgi:arsenite methyltransferase